MSGFQNEAVCYGNPHINKSSAVAEMGDRLATVDIGRKRGLLCPFLWGSMDRHLTQCPMGRGLPSYQVAF